MIDKWISKTTVCKLSEDEADEAEETARSQDSESGDKDLLKPEDSTSAHSESVAGEGSHGYSAVQR